MRAGILAFTDRGHALGARLRALMAEPGTDVSLSRCGEGGLDFWTRRHFLEDDVLIFIGAAGIAVRAVAPYVSSKLSDPAVLALDEGSGFVIPLLSGHIGGANRLAARLAGLLEATPVITTATDLRGVFAVDAWASRRNLVILNPERIKRVSARLLAGGTVRVKSMFPIGDSLPAGVVTDEETCDILITCRTTGNCGALILVPPVLTLGVGCRRGVPAGELEEAFARLLQDAECFREAVARVCSVDLKAGEPGLLDFCRTNGLPFQTFPAGELAALPGGFTASDFVREITGVDNVCERSAVMGSGGTLLARKSAGGGITMALAAAPYTVRFTEAE